MTRTETGESIGVRLLVALFLAAALHAGLLFAWKPTFYEPALAESLPGNGVSEVELIAWAPATENVDRPDSPERIEAPPVEEESPLLSLPSPDLEESEPTPVSTPAEEPLSDPVPQITPSKPVVRKQPKADSPPTPSGVRVPSSGSASKTASGSAIGTGPSTPPQQQASYLRNPHPSYPEDARRAGAEGVVLLRVMVSKTGRVTNVALDRSCGHSALDRRALETVKSRWVFRPARLNGKPVESEVLVPIRFSLR